MMRIQLSAGDLLLFSLLGEHRRRVVGHAPDPSRVH
jgi:hypothetical protein